VVPGGGAALIGAIAGLAKLKGDNEEQGHGIQIARRAMEAPLREIVTNAGDEPSVILKKVADGKGNYGCNAATGEYGAMVEMGILDPAKVTRTALQDAASIEDLMFTTEGMVAEAPKKDEGHGHGGGGGGMGGMGGMDFQSPPFVPSVAALRRSRRTRNTKSPAEERGFSWTGARRALRQAIRHGTDFPESKGTESGSDPKKTGGDPAGSSLTSATDPLCADRRSRRHRLREARRANGG
jgi:hypothetical protein